MYIKATKYTDGRKLSPKIYIIKKLLSIIYIDLSKTNLKSYYMNYYIGACVSYELFHYIESKKKVFVFATYKYKNTTPRYDPFLKYDFVLGHM